MSDSQGQLTIRDLKVIVRDWFRYVLSKWVLIVVVAFIFAVLGILYAWFQKPVYTAELTFASENSSASRLGSYAGLAAQFGIDFSGGGGTVFEGDNLLELLRSRLLVEKTLLTPCNINGSQEVLINYYIRVNKLDENWHEKPAMSKVKFTSNYQYGVREQDSVLKRLSKDIIDRSLFISKIDKNLNILQIKMSDNDEVFAKLFTETLTTTAIQYYIDYKVEKSRQNVQILQRQTDSVRNLLSGNIVSVAVSNDLNVNPVRQVVRANVQRKQVDVQVNSQVYGELLKQLEFAKITLRRETPLIKVIDTPQYPLEKKKLGRLKGGLIFGFLGGVFIVVILLLKKIFKG